MDYTIDLFSLLRDESYQVLVCAQRMIDGLVTLTPFDVFYKSCRLTTVKYK